MLWLISAENAIGWNQLTQSHYWWRLLLPYLCFLNIFVCSSYTGFWFSMASAENSALLFLWRLFTELHFVSYFSVFSHFFSLFLFHLSILVYFASLRLEFLVFLKKSLLTLGTFAGDLCTKNILLNRSFLNNCYLLFESLRPASEGVDFPVYLVS